MNGIYKKYLFISYKYKNPEKYLETKALVDLYYSLDYYKYNDKEYIKEYLDYVEKRFLESPKYATLYSINFLKKRWKKAEDSILKSNFYTEMYITNIIGNTWPDKYSTDDILYNFWYELMENKIFSDNNYSKLNYIKFNFVVTDKT